MTRPAKKGAGMLLSFVHALGAARPHSYRSLERELIGELGVLQHSVEHGLERADTKKDCYHRARNDDCSNVGVSPEGDVVPIDAGRCKTYMYWVNDGGGTTDDERQENPPRWVTKRCKNNGSGQCGNTGAGLMQLGVFRQPSVACQSTPGKVVAAEDADAFIFVDVDGTISPLDDANPGITDVAQKNLPDPKQIALLASLVNGFPGKRIAIVLSSSWRNTNSRTNRRRGHTPDTVSEALKMRGLALTAVLDPEPDMGWSPYGTFQTDRGWECMRFLAQHGKLGTPYVHLDDDAFDELFLGEWLGGGGPGKAAQNVIIEIAHDTEGWSEEQWEAARTDLVDSSARCNEKDFPGKRNPAGGQAQTKTCWVRPDKVIGLTNSDVRKAAELLAGQGI